MTGRSCMRAMVLEAPGQPLRAKELPIPIPGSGQIQLQVHACGVCRTDLHIIDGELQEPKPPLILGHQIIGTVTTLGQGADHFRVGERVLRSVANLTRRDGEEFMSIAPQVPVQTNVELFPLADANEALTKVRHGAVRGAAVLMIA